MNENKNKFGPDSTNPRQRRAYAHAAINSLAKGQGSALEALRAVDAATTTRKGAESGFEGALENAAAKSLDIQYPQHIQYPQPPKSKVLKPQSAEITTGTANQVNEEIKPEVVSTGQEAPTETAQPPRRISKRAKMAAALGITLGLGAGIGAVAEHTVDSGTRPIYQPASLTPTPSGSEVPTELQAPVGTVTSQVPGQPGEQITTYGSEPNGQTLKPEESPEPMHNPAPPAESSNQNGTNGSGEAIFNTFK